MPKPPPDNLLHCTILLSTTTHTLTKQTAVLLSALPVFYKPLITSRVNLHMVKPVNYVKNAAQ